MDVFWKILSPLLSVISTIFLGLLSLAFRSILSEIRGSIQKNAEEIAKVDKRHTEKVERLETSFNDLKADLPLIYVLREDYIRVMNNVEANIKDVGKKVDRVLEKIFKGGANDDG